MHRRVLLPLGWAILGAGLAPRTARAGPPGCAIPEDLLAEARPLQAAARALELGHLRILVVGSASTIRGGGPADGSPTWPQRLEVLLAQRHPGADITVAVRGGRGATVADNLVRLREGLRAEMPALVLWQAGTVEAARGIHPDEMTDVMREGLDAIRSARADVILMDPQYSRFLRANADIEPYRDKLRLLAASVGAALFPRYSLMEHWVETGALDLERTPRADRAAVLERLNACLADAVAELIVRGLDEAR